MFRLAMRILLGFDPERIRTDEQQLVEAFEEMTRNLFSLPIDVPFSGLYRVRALDRHGEDVNWLIVKHFHVSELV